MYKKLILFSIIALAFSSSDDWAEYLGGADRNHYSTLTQINPTNVDQLKMAWKYNLPDSGQMQVNPLIIKGVLYGVSSTVQAFALDAASGREIWRFGDPLKNWASTSRGVSYWTNGIDKRILYTVGPNLWALEAENGKPILSFGNQGKIDLHVGLPPLRPTNSSSPIPQVLFTKISSLCPFAYRRVLMLLQEISEHLMC